MSEFGPGAGGGAALLVSAGVTVTCVAYRRLIRPFIRTTVNCHFCNSNTKVKYLETNSWTCPSCQQYNGFTSDGDYNRPLDIIKSMSLRFVEKCGPSKPAQNGLCRSCNLNQELKISQLSDFPGEGKELDDYTAHLERVYRLCGECEDVLSSRLSAQDSLLTPSLLEARLETSRLGRSASQQPSTGWHCPSPALLSLPHLQLLLSLSLFLLLLTNPLHPPVSNSSLPPLPLPLLQTLTLSSSSSSPPIHLLSSLLSLLLSLSGLYHSLQAVLLSSSSSSLLSPLLSSLAMFLPLACVVLRLSGEFQLTAAALCGLTILLRPEAVWRSKSTSTSTVFWVQQGSKQLPRDRMSSRFIAAGGDGLTVPATSLDETLTNSSQQLEDEVVEEEETSVDKEVASCLLLPSPTTTTTTALRQRIVFGGSGGVGGGTTGQPGATTRSAAAKQQLGGGGKRLPCSSGGRVVSDTIGLFNLTSVSASPSNVRSRLNRSVVGIGGVGGGGGGANSQELLASPRLSSPVLRSGSCNSFNHEFVLDNQRDCDISSLSLEEEDEGEGGGAREDLLHSSRTLLHHPTTTTSISSFSPRLYSPRNESGIRFTPAPPATFSAGRPLIRPSRLTSWVAGGYWAPPTAVPGGTAGENLSRSSSQSSGFVSGSGPSVQNFPLYPQPQFPPHTTNTFSSSPYSSPVHSVCGGVDSYHDRLSVLSEPLLPSCRVPQIAAFPQLVRASSQVPENRTRSSRAKHRRPTMDNFSDGSDDEEDKQLLTSSPLSSNLSPVAQSSPVSSHPAAAAAAAATPCDTSSKWSITITITPYSLLLAASVAANLAAVYFYSQEG